MCIRQEKRSRVFSRSRALRHSLSVPLFFSIPYPIENDEFDLPCLLGFGRIFFLSLSLSIGGAIIPICVANDCLNVDYKATKRYRTNDYKSCTWTLYLIWFIWNDFHFLCMFLCMLSVAHSLLAQMHTHTCARPAESISWCCIATIIIIIIVVNAKWMV